MTIHYHGTPITPSSVLETLGGRNFCVSYANPGDIKRVHDLGQSVMLDNGAFTFWKRGEEATVEWWTRYAEWAEPWLEYPTTWAVIPDVIGGTEAENDLLIAQWPRDLFGQSAPVWHMNESLDRFRYLCHAWDKVCIGSSGEYATVGSSAWHRRMEAAMNAVCRNGVVPTWLHMLKGMATVDEGYPFASVDSTDIARNHHLPQHIAARMAARWDVMQCSPRWTHREQLTVV